MEMLGYVASFFMGVTLGAMGGGGSILTVPIMVYLFSVNPSTATGYSLFVVGTTALVGAGMYIRRGDVDFKTGLIFAIPSVIGVNLSRGLLLPSLPLVIANIGGLVLSKEILIMVTFASLMMFASYSMIKGRRESRQTPLSANWRMGIVAIEGLVVGVIAGFVGAGGGFLIIPALVILAGLHMRVAVGTSLMIIAFQSLLGFAGDVARGVQVEWSLLATIAAIAVVGIIGGSAVAHKIKEQSLKVAFGWFVLVMGAAILIEQIRHL